MNVEIVTIGDELLLGFTIDTNGAHLARELAQRGIAVVRRASCGDSAESIAGAVKDALERTGAVITTGGLGPTSDDLTKESIAAIFGRGMYLDESIVEGLNALVGRVAEGQSAAGDDSRGRDDSHEPSRLGAGNLA
jgi:nicotinamide-nucleotide amidase